MTFGQMKGKEPGLLFTSEVEENSDQSVLFTVPLLEEPRHPFALVDYFHENSFYFPALLNEKYLELEATADFPELIFTVPGTEFTITFELDIDPYYRYDLWRDFMPYPRAKYPTRGRRLKYAGEASRFIPTNRGFLPLLPLDVFEMDELYVRHRGVFVGLTPNFGEQMNLG